MATTLTLPYPPSTNSLYATVQGRRVLSRKGKAYAVQVWVLCREHGLFTSLPAPVRVTIQVYPPDHRRRDIDNVVKVVLDSLQKARVVNNDSDIDELHVVRCAVQPPAGALRVQLETIEEENANA